MEASRETGVDKSGCEESWADGLTEDLDVEDDGFFEADAEDEMVVMVRLAEDFLLFPQFLLSPAASEARGVVIQDLGWVSTERVTRRVVYRVTTRREISFRIASFLFTLNASSQIKHGNA